MHMPIEPNENIEAFMIHGKNKSIENFTQHLPNDSWI
jgi:metal-responsive CopG/Arc/MetJ family transcriptional regulator